MTLLAWLAVPAFVAVGVLVAALVRVRRERDGLLLQLGEEPRVRTVVVIDVRNADELAAERTRLARALSAVAPRATRALVHRELVRELREGLADQGVEVDTQLRRLSQWSSAVAAVMTEPVDDEVDDVAGA